MDWFISDTHFGHGTILRSRPFASVAEMDEAMISRWNAVVGPDDHVWHLGDFSAYRDGRLREVFWRLAGRKHLFIGNHDEENEAILDLPWEEPPVISALRFFGKQAVFMGHYPHRSWPRIGKGAIHLFGHMHGQMPGTTLSTDMAVEAWDFRPSGLDDILRRLRRNPPHPKREVRTEAADAVTAPAPAPGR